MISAKSIMFMFITLFITILLPIIILLLLKIGRKGVFGVWIAGALGFVIPQLFIRIPILQTIGLLPQYLTFTKTNPILVIFLLALSAALFESTGRLIILRLTLKNRLSYITGLTAGAGHGGIEAITLIGLTYVNNIVISFYLNAGRITEIIPNNQAVVADVTKALIETDSTLYLAAGFERIFAMMFHIAMSVLLTCFIVNSKTLLGFGIILFLHFSLDFFTVLAQQKGVNFYYIEGGLFVVALLSLFLVYRLKSAFGVNQMIPADAAEKAVDEGY